MDENSDILGPPVSFAEFNDLCDCKLTDEHQHKQSPQIVGKYLLLELSDTKPLSKPALV